MVRRVSRAVAALILCASWCPAQEGVAAAKAVDIIDKAVREAGRRVAVSKKDRSAFSREVLRAFEGLPKGDAAETARYIAGIKDEPVRDVLKRILAATLPDPRVDEEAGGAIQGPEFDVRRRIIRDFYLAEPREPESNYDMGRVYFLEGDYRSASEAFGRAYELGDHRPQVLVYYAGAAHHAGDYRLAAQAARLVLEADPGHREARALYQFSKDRSSTVQLPSVLGPDLQDLSAPGAPAAGAPPPAARSGVLELAAERSLLLTKEAANALRLRDYDAAYRHATRAVEFNARNAQALNYRAAALTQLGRYREAEQDAGAALALAPENATILLTRSRALSRQGRHREALQDADAALLRGAANAFAHEGRAFALAGLHENAAAVEALREAARLEPRLQGRLEQALRLPQDGDLTLIFDEASFPAQSSGPSPSLRPRRFARLVLLTSVGGLLIALGVLHVVSASWRDKLRMTVRRALTRFEPSSSGPEDPPLAAGAFWTQYQLVKEIGLGGMGVVYEAVDRSLERRVAVKKMREELRLDPQDRRRFVVEARLVAQLHHPNIVDIYAIVEDASDIYLVFEFVEGLTLQDALKSSGPMDFAVARRVLREICAAVEHAHEKGVIHRDLKPSNVMLGRDGRVKVMDFGVARQAKDSLAKQSMTNAVVGTPPYMAPEQEQGIVRKESDVYALGVCFYEMLTGSLPFGGSGAAMLLNKLNGRLVLPSRRIPALASALDEVMSRALSPDPEKRYRTPGELMAALDVLRP